MHDDNLKAQTLATSRLNNGAMSFRGVPNYEMKQPNHDFTKLQ